MKSGQQVYVYTKDLTTGDLGFKFDIRLNDNYKYCCVKYITLNCAMTTDAVVLFQSSLFYSNIFAVLGDLSTGMNVIESEFYNSSGYKSGTYQFNLTDLDFAPLTYAGLSDVVINLHFYNEEYEKECNC